MQYKRIALVTGANQGVGLRVAKELVANGVTGPNLFGRSLATLEVARPDQHSAAGRALATRESHEDGQEEERCPRRAVARGVAALRFARKNASCGEHASNVRENILRQGIRH
jgi:NAD(P)-dependent dehydrogenase (short-subunit alcohol dehydrogenase family)